MRAPRTERRRLPRAERQEQMLDIAEEMFVTGGYSATSIEDIASAAGISRPIVYEHFGTKEGIYLACVRRARAGYEQLLLSQVDPGAPARAQLAAGADSFFRLLDESPQRWQLLFGSNAVLPGEYQQELAEMRFATIEQIAMLLRPLLRGLEEDRVVAFAHSISGVGERLGHWWLRRPDLRREDLVEHFLDVVWSGVGAYAVDPGTG